MAKIKMTALKVFPFRGEPLEVGDDFEPDNKEQADLLRTIGLADYRKRNYLNRMGQSTRAAVMTTDASRPSVLSASPPDLTLNPVA